VGADRTGPADRERLFVYGTLRVGRAPAGLAGWLAPLARRPATVAGRLLDLGAYPGAILAPVGAGEPTPAIVGELVEVPRARLPELDRYEGYDPADPCRSLFVRERTEALLDDGGRVACWVYTWAGGALGPEVPGGDWLARGRSR
jgi:gamma-glutamylcyclotransferase (GGCT)/AIG2-like uncharacterized protein YtfP